METQSKRQAMTPHSTKIEVTVRTNEGENKTVPATDLTNANKIAKQLRTHASYMVCIVEDGVRTQRWDRPTVVGENKWRKEELGAFERLGKAREIVKVTEKLVLRCYQVGDSDWVAATSPEEALLVMHQLEGEEDQIAYAVVLSSDEELDQGWAKPDEPEKCVGSLRQWLEAAKKPCWLACTAS
ncbi:hypothetical protein H8F21_15680 [Pseudomonas sp. P66]|uniref:Plasmid conjugative transfer protein PilI domain-containing protein n=1 Tax=Pseudomonas arcuscaelestis TaxID=2710591 RepID=A0ABS2C0Y6_9PSED|nr:hypothetical protein [Pseudomonas arcuscaelestis]MBM5459008.1 hypothetical protein [Pseudomonas arcuscaelestis]